MKTRNWILAGLAFAAILIVVLISIRKEGSRDIDTFKPINPAFAQYISAYTSGLVSSRSSIQVVLAYEFADSSEINQELTDILEFSPKLKGKTFWKNSRTIEFKPDNPLEQGEMYKASFKLDKLLQVPDSLAVFEFGFQTIRQDFTIEVRNLINYNWEESKWKYLDGRITCADGIDTAKLKGLLSAEFRGQDRAIRWSRVSDFEYNFSIDSLERAEKKKGISLRWNGKEIGVKKEGKAEIEMPAMNVFKVSKTAVELGASECIVVEFTDALQSNQELRGLISMGNTALNFSIDKNLVRVFYSNLPPGEYNLVVSPGIKNWNGDPLPRQSIHKINIEDLKPALRKAGDGVILPSTEGLIYPFDAVNLKSVNIKVVQIYEKSIPQFLQTNDINENQELHRVGKVMIRKTIELGEDGKTNLGQWNRFGIDISELIKVEPGAIYRISMGFTKAQSIYPCHEGDDVQRSTMVSSEGDYYEEGEEYYDDYEYWDYGNQFYSYSDFQDEGMGISYHDYRWTERENPCSNSYYYDKTLSQNILASDIGMSVKKFDDGGMSFFITDLVSSAPISGASIKLLDYQLRSIAETKTDGNGFASIDQEGKPFLAMAKYGKHQCYLPLWEGKSLSMSTFDIEGQKSQKGIKGFIFTERGVWRPGDTIFANFILEDRDKSLPPNFPLVAELYNARGKLCRKQISKSPVEGIYAFRFPTQVNDQTGTFRVVMKIGGSTFTKTLKVETIKPNRLKINLNIKDNKILLSEQNPIDLKVDWLHGAVGKDLKADVVMTLKSDPSAFEKQYKDFQFQNPFEYLEMEAVKVAEGTTDENGRLSIVPELEVSDAPGVLKASLTTKVYEKGGGFSIHYSNAQVYPYSSYVGIKVPKGSGWWQEALETGMEHTFTFVNVDSYGNKKKHSKVQLKVYRSDWYWWWHQGSGTLANFLAREGTSTYLTQNLSLSSGSGTYKFKVRKQEYGNYVFVLTDLESGHSCGSSIYMYWPDAPVKEKKEGANLLTISADKEKYNVGETIKLSLPSNEGGHVMFSIEKAGKQIYHEVVKTEEGSTSFEFKAEKSMTPNVYVFATLLNRHEVTAKGLPLRMYGVIPIMIEDPLTRLNPKISMPEEVRPESKVNIKVSEANGKAMAYTIAIVDEGLLDLTSFKTPDPWGYFYAKEALGVRTWDMYDQVIGATGGKFENTVSIGGGDDGPLGEKGSPRANRFKAMVIHLGPFFLKANATATHQVSIPKYIGSVRVMVVAAKDFSYGNAEKTVKVNSPVMVLGSLPRVAGPKEEIELPVTVFAMKPEVKSVEVSIKANSLFELIGPAKQTLKFNRPGEAVLNYKLRCKEAVGIAKVEITAVSGNLRSVYEVEMDVRSANPLSTRTQSKVLLAGESAEIDLNTFGLEGTNSGLIQLSSLPAMDLENRLQYLISYPHGCLEQVTSAAFPQLYLSDLLTLTPQDEADISRNVNVVINKISNVFSREDGGFSYWPGSNYVNEWTTSYAGHFLLEAKKKGYVVPDNTIREWANYQKSLARQFDNTRQFWYSFPDHMQAYRLYTLALSGNAELGLMNRLRERPGLSTQARWRLAAAYAIAGRLNIAKELVYQTSSEITAYNEMGYTFGSRTRDQAMILETLVLLGEKETAAKIVFSLAKDLASDRWYSTQSTAYALISISKYVGKLSSAKGLIFEYSYAGGPAKKVSSIKDIAQETLGVKNKLKSGKLKIRNMGSNTLYLEVYVKGQPLAGTEINANSNLFMDVEYTDLEGNSINPAKIIHGTDFYAIVTVRHPNILSAYTELALSQVFPSGWEIINRRMEDDGLFDYNYDFQDIRDDRVLTYFSLPKGKEKVIKVQLNAAYKGKFYMGGTLCEAMYDKSISSSNKGSWVEVTE